MHEKYLTLLFFKLHKSNIQYRDRYDQSPLKMVDKNYMNRFMGVCWIIKVSNIKFFSKIMI